MGAPTSRKDGGATGVGFATSQTPVSFEPLAQFNMTTALPPLPTAPRLQMVSQTALLVSKNLKLQVPRRTVPAPRAHRGGRSSPSSANNTAARCSRPPTLPSHDATALPRASTPQQGRSVVATATQVLIGIIFLSLIAVMQFSLENSGAVRPGVPLSRPHPSSHPSSPLLRVSSPRISSDFWCAERAAALDTNAPPTSRHVTSSHLSLAPPSPTSLGFVRPAPPSSAPHSPPAPSSLGPPFPPVLGLPPEPQPYRVPASRHARAVHRHPRLSDQNVLHLPLRSED